jgi:hypothetical protein
MFPLGFLLFWRNSPQWTMGSSFTRFLDHTQRRATVGRTSLEEWSGRRRDLYLTTHNTHNRQTSMPTVGFEHTISAGERQQTYALDRAATGPGPLQFSTFLRVFLDWLTDWWWWWWWWWWHISNTWKCRKFSCCEPWPTPILNRSPATD